MDVNEELKVFFENSKKNCEGEGGRGWIGGSGWGVRVDVNEELKFLGKFTIKKIGGVVGVGRGGQVGVVLVGGQGGFERRIEGFGKIHK